MLGELRFERLNVGGRALDLLGQVAEPSLVDVGEADVLQRASEERDDGLERRRNRGSCRVTEHTFSSQSAPAKCALTLR